MKRLLASAVLLCGLALIVVLIAPLDCKKGKDQPLKDGPPKNSQPVPEMQSDVTVTAKGREPVAEKSIFPAQWKLSREVENAITKGALAKVTLRVADSAGNPVPRAHVKLNFTVFERRGNFSDGFTDEEGLFTSEKESMSDCNWFIEKEGYYNTEGRHSFAANLTNDSVKNGRWQPWNPTLVVVLKEKRNPIPMYTKRVEAKMPVRDLPIGYDFRKGDWVEPYGQGNDADITLTYSETPRTNTWRRYDFTIAFTNRHDGAYLKKKDKYSQFGSMYEADTNNYQPVLAFVYERTEEKILQEKRITEDEMLVFRVRTKTDANGNVTEAYYGKIDGPCKFADGPQRFISISYYFNPTPNDRNLEFDGKNNLFNPDWRDSWPRNP